MNINYGMIKFMSTFEVLKVTEGVKMEKDGSIGI